MSLKSDLNLDFDLFDPAKTDEVTKAVNNFLIQNDTQRWHDEGVGAEKHTDDLWHGRLGAPPAHVIESGINMRIPSRDAGRELDLRVFKPESGSSKGVFIHMHGSGWVIYNNKFWDPQLKYWTDTHNLTVVSVGYRLAPKNPWPAMQHDCFDAIEWIIDNAQSQFGAPALFMGGESAGAHLSLLTFLHLLTTRPSHSFHGLILHCGAYNLTFLPYVHHFSKPLILPLETILAYREAAFPSSTFPPEALRDPAISPFFADLRGLKLPPALFTVGTEDPLMEDSVLMCARWQMAGGEGVLKVYNGAAHGFSLFWDREEGEAGTKVFADRGPVPGVAAVRRDEGVFIAERMG